MKVLFVSNAYHPHGVGGAEATVKLLAEGVARAGNQAVVVTLSPDGRRHERVIDGVRVHYLPLFNVYFHYGPNKPPSWLKPIWHLIEAFNPVMARRVMEIVASEAPDVVNLHNLQGFSSAVWPALANHGIPTVQTLHDHYSVCANSTMYRQDDNCRTRCIRCRIICAPRVRLSRRVDVLTCVSRRLRDRMLKFGAYRGVPNIMVIPGSNNTAPQSRNRGQGHGSPLVLGFLGRLEPIKGLEVLLDAASRIGPEHVHVRVGGAGSQDYENSLKARYSGPGVTFLGRVQPEDFLTELDMLVVPSLVEDSLPRVVHEAFGYGVPVVGADIGGISEMIRPGETGYLVPSGDVTALEQLIRKLISSPPDWSAMSAACLSEADRYSFDLVFDAYRHSWNSAIELHRRQGNSPVSCAVS